MVAADSAASIVYAVVALFIVIALIAIWRVVIHDKSVTRVRLGLFYERERETDLDHDHDEEESGPQEGAK